MLIQKIGRGLRLAKDKRELTYYDYIFEGNKYLEAHSRERVMVLEKEGHDVVLIPKEETEQDAEDHDLFVMLDEHEALPAGKLAPVPETLPVEPEAASPPPPIAEPIATRRQRTPSPKLQSPEPEINWEIL